MSEGRWAKDPTGRYPLRWWDGIRWTDRVAWGQSVMVDPVDRPVVAGRKGLSRGKAALIVAGSVGLFGMLVFTAVLAGSSKSKVSDQTRELEAFDVCQRAVSNRLRSPGSAKWRDPTGDQVSYSGSGDGPWTVSASVDSQNGFGALLRSDYTCTATYSGGTWTVTDVRLGGG